MVLGPLNGKFCFSTFIILPARTLQEGQIDFPEQMQKTAFGSYLPTPTSLRPFQAPGNLPKPAPPLPWAGPTPRNPDSYPSPRTFIPYPLRGVGAAGAGGGAVACPSDQGAALRQRWPGAQSDRATPRERPNSRALSLRRAASARWVLRPLSRCLSFPFLGREGPRGWGPGLGGPSEPGGLPGPPACWQPVPGARPRPVLAAAGTGISARPVGCGRRERTAA